MTKNSNFPPISSQEDSDTSPEDFSFNDLSTLSIAQEPLFIPISSESKIHRVIRKITRLESISKSEVEHILRLGKEILSKESALIEVSSPTTICGDIHGQLPDLLEIFRIAGEPPETSYLFMGDYVDRGHDSVECFTLLLSLKLLYPSRVVLLRGNHESASVTKIYGFYDECRRKFSGGDLYRLFCDTFDVLPLAATVDGQVFAVHGGIDPALEYVENVKYYQKGQDVPHEGPISGMLWSDPKDGNGWEHSVRGAGHMWGKDETDQFLHTNGLNLICRAHQLAEKGYSYWHGGKVLTIFSAPNYCYRCGNMGAVMKYDFGKKEILNYWDAAKYEHEGNGEIDVELEMSKETQKGKNKNNDL